MKNKYLNINKYTGWLRKKTLGIADVTYSQCGEDLILDYFFHHKSEGVYIDVGANDPRLFSNTYYFYKKGWRGIVIEPNSKVLSKYKFTRSRDERIQCAIGERGSFTFYKFKEDALNTMSEEVARSYEKMGHKILSKETVPSVPLSDIFKSRNLKHVDLLSVDTEGQNFEVLQTNDWETFRPTFVLVETAEYDKPDDESLEGKFNLYMEKVGYKKVANTPMNTIYKDDKK